MSATLTDQLLSRPPTLDAKNQFDRLLVNPPSPGLCSVVQKHRQFVVISSYLLLCSEQVDISALSVKAVMSPQAAS